jgi:hypothetical protein
MSNTTQDHSRRNFCKLSAIASLSTILFITLGPRLAAAQAKLAQKDVEYQNTPKGTQRCDACKLFQAPNACKSVDGPIDPAGWCTLFQSNQ